MSVPATMTMRTSTRTRATTFRLALAICVAAVSNFGVTGSASAQSAADLALKARVEATLMSASDVPGDSITVEGAIQERVVFGVYRALQRKIEDT